MTMHKVLIITSALLLLAACSHRRVTQEIFVPDVSESITSEASDAMWGELSSMAARLRRGDSLLILPITPDAGNDISGRSLLESAPDIRDRKSLDEDLDEMRAKAAEDIQNLRKQLRSRRLDRTDLLGTFRVISEKVQALPKGDRAVVLVMSDFIQDDAQFDFKTNPRLESPELARLFAKSMAQQEPCPLRAVTIYLGYLESKDLAPLSRRRRDAIEAFWVTFLSEQGAQVQVATDGPGSARAFIDLATAE